MNKAASTMFAIYGWYGTVAIIVAYFLISFGFGGDLLLYQFLNLTGSVALGVIAFMKKAWQPAVLEVVWAVIAGASLIWIMR